MIVGDLIYAHLKFPQMIWLCRHDAPTAGVFLTVREMWGYARMLILKSKAVENIRRVTERYILGRILFL